MSNIQVSTRIRLWGTIGMLLGLLSLGILWLTLSGGAGITVMASGNPDSQRVEAAPFVAMDIMPLASAQNGDEAVDAGNNPAVLAWTGGVALSLGVMALLLSRFRHSPAKNE